MADETEGVRRFLVHRINASLSPDEQQRYHELCLEYGEDNVFDPSGLQENFEMLEFLSPYVLVIRKSDNQKGTLMFSHSPRFYFGFTPV
jgi:hypothetical protein